MSDDTEVTKTEVPKVVGKKTTDFPVDDVVSGNEKIYAVDDGRDVNITTEQIKNYTLTELKKMDINLFRLSSVGW